MATSTLIQRLDTTALVTSTTIPGGYQTVSTPDVSHRRQVETFIAGGTVAVGDWVAFDASKSGATKVLTVVRAGAAANGNPLVVGVVLGSAETSGALTAGSKINVVVSGYVASANTNGAPAAGQPLVVQTVAGAADAAGAGITAPPCGAVLADLGGGKAEVWVYGQF
jgi:hypothetical protein